MKYSVALGVFLIGILTFLAACGSTTSPSGSAGGQATPAASQTGQTPTSSTGTQTVNVALFDDHMSSSLMSFATGIPYHFVVTNHGHHPYTFSMMSQAREQEMEHMPMAQRHQAALYTGNTIAPGQTNSFDYTFGSSMMGQPLEFACYQQGANQVHMRLPFTVQS